MNKPTDPCDVAGDVHELAEKLFATANRRTDEYLTTLGHEMRNPLSALSGALSLWPNAQDSLEEMEKLRGLMQRQVDHLLRMSDDLLDVARIAQGKFELRCELFDLNQTVKDACEEINAYVLQCGHVMHLQISAEPLLLDGDASRLLQVFANIIQNAAKFTPVDGELFIETSILDGAAMVRIRDNGRGLEAQMLSTIFEPYFQVNGVKSQRNDGLGVGLRLAKSIVELHGGQISANSEGLGHGSEFTVQLPLTKQVLRPDIASPAATIPERSDKRRPLKSHRIMVVDDNSALVELTARLLQALGQEVSTATNAEDAIQRIRQDPPQFVFLDIVLRGMSGIEAARQLRSHEELAGVILIALSGNGDAESKKLAIAAGFDRYLVKPVSKFVLAEVIADHSRG